MQKGISAVFALCAAMALGHAQAAEWRAASERSAGGFVNPESVGCDLRGKMLYVGNFGSPKLDPALKDGMGYISKVALDGKIIEKKFLPAPGGEPLNKPKGIWIAGNRLWVTDIDSVWVFDLKTRKGRKLPLPGVIFANDPAVMDGALYVSDNRGDRMMKVEPADFLNMKGAPRITEMFSAKNVNPNGVYPGPDGMLLMVGFVAPDKPRGIYALGVSGQVKELSPPLGRLDGLYDLRDGSLLVTDWNTGSLFRWDGGGGMRKLADGFKGPADFCVFPQAGGLTVVVPDLVQSQLRFIQLRK